MNVQSNRIIGWVFLAIILIGGGCAKLENMNIPFFSSNSDEYPRAFYVEKKRSSVRSNKVIRLEGNLKDLIRVLETSVQSVTDTTTNILRIRNDGEAPAASGVPILRVTSPILEVDTMPDFEEYFYVGDYILDQPGYRVAADQLTYDVNALVKLRGNIFMVSFAVNGHIEWNIYKENKNGVMEKVKEDREKMYGVGSYRYEKRKTFINRRGEEEEYYEWEEIPIKDQPTSKGILEERLLNAVIEVAADHDVNAIIQTSY
ncbi:MAG: hypothetical protein ACQETE_01955 [Bacteroidota bacterium]